jgi:phenylpyruvate tautomerase PptA (4-oxalocrotonate tautomerase family)
MFEGRSVEAKKRLIQELFRLIPEATGITANDIEITLFETPRHNWGIRGVPGDELGLSYRVEV